MDEGFTSFMVSVENDTGSTNNVLLKQPVYIFILLVKEMELCFNSITDPEVNSHGNTRKRNGLIHKVNVFLFVKFIHVFNSLNHWGHVQIVIPVEKISKSFKSRALEATDNFLDQFLVWRLNIIFVRLLVLILLGQSVFEMKYILLLRRCSS